MQRTLQWTHENWIYIKSIFLELIINISIFSYSKQDKKKNMQTSPNNFHKICTGTKHVNKANKSGFAILSFSENIYAINNISDSKHEIETKP